MWNGYKRKIIFILVVFIIYKISWILVFIDDILNMVKCDFFFILMIEKYVIKMVYCVFSLK